MKNGARSTNNALQSAVIKSNLIPRSILYLSCIYRLLSGGFPLAGENFFFSRFERLLRAS